MKREESIKFVKTAAIMGILHVISALLMDVLPMYGMNVVITSVPYCWLLCEFLGEKPREGMLLTVVLISALLVFPISFRMAGILVISALGAEVTYMFALKKKEIQECKVSLITTFNTMLYPLLILWELLATEGESTIMMDNFTLSVVFFVAVHVLGFVGIKLSLKEKAEFH